MKITFLGGADEVGDTDAGDLARILEGEENAGAGTLVNGHFKNPFSLQGDGAAGDNISFVAGDDLGKGGFSGAVWPHDGVDFAGWDLKADAFEDFGAVFESGVEVLDMQAHVGENSKF